MESKKSYSLEEALQAQAALRNLAGLEPETFPIEAFVGMISDEIEKLRSLGHSDEEIAAMVRKNSRVEITGAEISDNYASPELRRGHHE